MLLLIRITICDDKDVFCRDGVGKKEEERIRLTKNK